MTEYHRAPEPPTVAVAYDDEGNEHARCYAWEAGQNYALHEGLRVVAVADDGGMTKANAQALYDAERDRYRDCYGVTTEPAPIQSPLF